MKLEELVEQVIRGETKVHDELTILGICYYVRAYRVRGDVRIDLIPVHSLTPFEKEFTYAKR